MEPQKLFLKIVQTWNIKFQPEYRGFRCANCQKYMHKAWYHWLNYGGFKAPVHFCSRCEAQFQKGNIVISNPPVKMDKSQFLRYPNYVKQILIETVSRFPLNDKPRYKIFTCDSCNKNMIKAFHVWDNQNKDLAEIHFCKSCWHGII